MKHSFTKQRVRIKILSDIPLITYSIFKLKAGDIFIGNIETISSDENKSSYSFSFTIFGS